MKLVCGLRWPKSAPRPSKSRSRARGAATRWGARLAPQTSPASGVRRLRSSRGLTKRRHQQGAKCVLTVRALCGGAEAGCGARRVVVAAVKQPGGGGAGVRKNGDASQEGGATLADNGNLYSLPVRPLAAAAACDDAQLVRELRLSLWCGGRAGGTGGARAGERPLSRVPPGDTKVAVAGGTMRRDTLGACCLQQTC